MHLDPTNKADFVTELLRLLQLHLQKIDQKEGAFAKSLGMSDALFKNLRKGSMPSVDRLSVLLQELGVTLVLGSTPSGKLNGDYVPSSKRWDTFTEDLLPRKGIASCGIGGWGKDQPINDPLPAPEALDDPDAFYVSASGQSMLQEGIDSSAFCLVSPARKAVVGDRVWIRDKNNGTAIKRLVKITDESLHLRGWMPRKDGKQESLDEERLLNFIAEYHPVIAVYKGKPGSEKAHHVPDPNAQPGEANAEMIAVQLHDQQFAAGHGALADEGIMSSVAFPAPWLRGMGLSERSAALVWINGDSMEPTLKSGAMAMLDTRIDDVKKRNIYAFRFGDELFIKRLERIGRDLIIAHSDNPEYDTIAISGSDLERFELYGAVVWSGHKVGG